MTKSMLLQVAAAGATLLGTTGALAQVDTPPPAPATPAAPGISDHDQVVGHLGIGYLGRQTIQIASAAATPTPVTAPVVGVRYWLDPMLGIDAGAGFSLTSGSTETDTGAASETIDKVGVTAVIGHVGVPLALASSQHFSFQIIPETNLGFAGATVEGDSDTGTPDVKLSGFHWDIGARAGAEVHFGFIDIPQLSLQAGIGLALQLDNVKQTVKTTPEASVSDSTLTVGTTLAGDPWELFVGNLSALYYF